MARRGILLVTAVAPVATAFALGGGLLVWHYGLDGAWEPLGLWAIASLAGVAAAVAGARIVSGRVARRTNELEAEVVRCRASEARLRESERRTSGIVESAMDAIVSVDDRQRIVLFNPAAEAMFGRKTADVMGQPLEILIPERFRTAHADHVRRFGETGVTVRQMGALGEIKGLRGNGEEFPIEAAISQVSLNGGKLFTVVLRDITDRKRYEERIRNLTSVLRGIQQINQLIVREGSRDQLVEGACRHLVSTRGFRGAWLAVVDADGRIVTASQAGLNGKANALLEQLHAGHLPACAVTALAQRGVLKVTEASGGHCAECPIDNHCGSAALAARLEHSGRVHGVLVVYGEQTGEIAQEELSLLQELADDLGLALQKFELEQQRIRLEAQFLQAQKMEAVGRLAGGIAHDFRNQLTVIGGYCDLLLTEIPEDSPLIEELSEVRNAALRAEELTNQLLAFSRKQDLQPRVVNLNEVISEIAKPIARMLGEDVEFSMALATDPGMVEVDPAHLGQAIMNLVANARDAMPEGGRLHLETANVDLDGPYARLHPEVAPGPHVMLAVSDTGVGMDSETVAQVFEPFFTTKEKGKGTGLGLSMVYGFVKQSGGSIFVYAEPGHGTTFKLYFPRSGAGEASTHSLRPAPQQAAASGTETILLVEDNEGVRGLAKQILETCGYAVLEAAEADQAISIVDQYPGSIDLLLTDVVMPGASGPELADRLLAEHPGMKALFMSGYTGDAIDRHGLAKPGANLLPKPFGPAALAQAVRETLDTGAAGARRG